MTTIYATAYAAARAAAQEKADAMRTPGPFVKPENWPDVRRGIVFDVALEAGHNTAPSGAGSAEWDDIDRAVDAAVRDALAIQPPHHLGTEVIYCPVCKTMKRVERGQDVCEFCQADDVLSHMHEVR